jgi:glycosyltransferase involved in cell wall biosynthesis
MRESIALVTRRAVLFLSNISDFKGGAEKSLFDLMGNPSVRPVLLVPEEGEMAAEARRREYDVVLVELGQVARIRRPFRPASAVWALRDALRAAKRIKATARGYDALCVHSNGLKAHGIACLARLLGGPPIVAHFRAIPFTFTEYAFWWLVRLLAARMILVSRPCWPGRRLPANARVIHNGISPPRSHLEPRAFQRPFRIGFAGRLQHTKNVELLIQWFAHARRQGFDATLTIRGEALEDEQDYAEGLKKAVEDLGLTELCRFEGRQEGIEAIYADFDVNVVPSRIPDPLPRSVMEALASGIPVIGYPAGGIPDMIKHGETGFLAHDEASFLAALLELTKSPERYHEIREQGLAHVLANFSLARLQRDVTSEYEAIARTGAAH